MRLRRILSRLIFSRVLIIIMMLLLQILSLIFLVLYVQSRFSYIIEIVNVLSMLLMIYMINEDEPTEFKLTWAVFLCFFSIFGVLMFIFVKSNYGMVGLRKKVNREIENTKDILYTSEQTKKALSGESRRFKGFASYMENIAHYPVYHNTVTEYFDSGESTYESLVKDLKDAKEFIFLEFFIICRGYVWDGILEILKEKVKEGVEVRVMYDGLCTLKLLPYRYPKKLEEYGIQAKMFAPVVPFLSTTQNNRDHRKIVVIDGKVAYTGGVNLSDEYVNKVTYFGHWKDIALRLEGRAVESFTLMFLQMWNLYGKDSPEYEKYLLRTKDHRMPPQDGFVIPYGDTPTQKTEIAKTVYESILTYATKYIHIMTPYFIVDREFLDLMKYAAERGVEVKMIIPHIPDKKVVYYIARTYYKSLMDSGIQIYEYTPGFIHAKSMIADDRFGVVGSVNLDYRSFYHHFECGVYMYDSYAIKGAEEDFNRTVERSLRVTPEYYKDSIPLYQKITGRVMRIIAPLL